MQAPLNPGQIIGIDSLPYSQLKPPFSAFHHFANVHYVVPSYIFLVPYYKYEFYGGQTYKVNIIL